MSSIFALNRTALLDSCLPPNSLSGVTSLSDKRMNRTAPPLELHALEKLREEELEEARAIQSVMLPAESLRAGEVMIAHEFQPVRWAAIFWIISS
jgi:hypothetical protein